MSDAAPARIGLMATLVVILVGAIAFTFGFYVLPGNGKGATDSIWQRMCRAAGLNRTSPVSASAVASPVFTHVVVPQGLYAGGTSEQIGHGATLALSCAVCHGARGVSDANAPNLAGQHPEVIYKELLDYQRGARTDPVMNAMAASLSTDNIVDLSRYYASLPPENVVLMSSNAPALVRVGDPMRNIAPCGSCHGALDHRKGAPSLNGQPYTYLTAQLRAFASGARRNDANADMRSVARGLSDADRGVVARYYAGTAQ